MSESPFPRRLKVHPFPEGMDWINTAGPIELKDLRGKFVLLDFWTYCCINCVHVLPELKKLEKAYPQELVVIGVHSAKFDREKQTENITEAVLRYKIEHPVLNDSQLVVWRRFGVRSWPTLVLIDTEGYAVWGRSGEATFEQLDEVVKRAVSFYKKKGLLDLRPIQFDAAGGIGNDESQRAPKTALRFPGKVLADEPGDRLFIADSNHNRIVVARLDGRLREIIGGGSVGSADGDFATAQFQQPQGMALYGETLYVADTENHLLRKVDLTKKRVATVAGTGRQSRGGPPWPGRLTPLGRDGHATDEQATTAKPRQTALNSPWALWVHNDPGKDPGKDPGTGGQLYIAMAGAHQIWRMRLDGSEIEVYAGNGREDIVDGPLAPQRPFQTGFASFAQPSGLASDGEWLYVADSEGSSIRAVPFSPGREVRTLVGTSHLPAGRLFSFGDVDGRGREVRLQHALGVVYYQGKLYVADTYNNKIKVIDPRDGATQTLAGRRESGRSDDPPRFDEPAGITAAAGKLFVADTNNHLIRVIDLGQQNRVTTLSIAGLGPPDPAEALPADSAVDAH